MIFDSFNEFSDSQAVTSTAISSNVYDLGPLTGANTVRDIGQGRHVWLIVAVPSVAFTAAGAATCTITLESDSTANLATSPVVHYTTTAIAKASMGIGVTLVAIHVPPGQYKQYLGVRYTVATGPMTAGSVDAFLTADAQQFQAYARNYTNIG